MDPKNVESSSAGAGEDADEMTLAQKRSRRVSFAKTIAVHVFDRDEDFETPPDSKPSPNEESSASLLKFSSGDEEEGEESGFPPEHSDSEEDDDDVQERFIRDMYSSSPGSVAGSATSNDDEMAGHKYSYDKMSKYYPPRKSSRRYNKRKSREYDSDRDYYSKSKDDEYHAQKKSQVPSSYTSGLQRPAHSEGERDIRRDSQTELQRHTQSGSSGFRTHRGTWPSSITPPRRGSPPPPPAQDPTAQQKMEELQAKFPDICFDDLQFVPQLHTIPSQALQTTIGVNQDVYFQHGVLNQLVRKVSAVSIQRKKEIEILRLQAESDKATLDDQHNKLNDYEGHLKAEEDRAKETAEAINRLEATHKRELDKSINRCGAIALEKDELHKKNESLKARLAEMKTRLKAEQEEKLAAQLESQKYCEEALAVTIQKEKLDKEAAELEGLKEQIREEGRVEIKQNVDILFSAHNARLLIHRDLTFMGEDYHESLLDAWDQVLNIKEHELGADNVDEEALICEILRGREPNDLAIAKALYIPEPAQGAEAGPSGTKSLDLTEAQMLEHLTEEVLGPDARVIDALKDDKTDIAW